MVEMVIIHLGQGVLKGRRATNRFGVPYYSFQGIPYAKPPVGPLRFKPPEPPEPWQGIRDALEEGNDCPQLDVLQNNVCKGSEDSLFLNVYTLKLPCKQNNEKKAVMVWIHGGGFGFGSGSRELHGPDYLVEQDVVLVTINYRLGPLGFLSLPEAGVPGNNGLKDQVMSLHWIQKNITKFGGDPNNVTIFGTSAGAASVIYHLLSPMSKGLFHRAIAQSGTALNPWAYDDPITARNKAFKLGEKLGLKTSDPNDLLQYLKNLTAKDIVEGLYKSLTDEDKLLLTIYSVPTCDNSGNSEEVFLPDSPHALLNAGKFNDVPLIIGTVSHEGMLMLKEVTAKPFLWEYVDNNFEAVIPHNLNLTKDCVTTKDISKKVREFYFEDDKVSKETVDRYIELNTDAQFLYGVNCTVRQHVEFCKSPVFYYQFTLDGKLALLKNLIGVGNVPGTCHGDDTAYVFNPSVLNIKLEPDMIEVKVIHYFAKMWTNFAKTGNPTPELDHELGIIWKPATAPDLPFLTIGKDMKMACNLRKDRVDFWEEVYNSVGWKN